MPTHRLTLVLAVMLAVGSVARAQDAGTPPEPASAARPQKKAEPVAPKTGLVELSTPGLVKELCLATRPPSRVLFAGDEVEQGEAKQAFGDERRRAMTRLYKARVPAAGFRLGRWDPRAETLSVDFTRPLRTLHGALSVSVPSDAPLAMPVRSEAAPQATAAVASGTAVLDVYFELDDMAGAPCSGSVAVEVFSVAARPVAIELRDGTGQLLGRAETDRADEHRDILGGYSGVPTVSLGPVQSDDGLDPAFIASRLRSIIDPVRRCYEARLADAPSTSGVAVVGVTVGAGGQVEQVSFIADALGHASLRECVDRSIRSLRFSGVEGLFRVPVELTLAPRR